MNLVTSFRDFLWRVAIDENSTTMHSARKIAWRKRSKSCATCAFVPKVGGGPRKPGVSYGVVTLELSGRLYRDFSLFTLYVLGDTALLKRDVVMILTIFLEGQGTLF